MSAREADARARNELKESRANNGLLRLQHNPEPKSGIILSKVVGHLAIGREESTTMAACSLDSKLYLFGFPELRHDWVYVVDADEWVSPQLAEEIAALLSTPACAAIAHRLRVVLQGTWIRYCGWYIGSWAVRLVDRRYAKFDGSPVGERVRVDGPVGRLANDILDEDRKSQAAWLHKHVNYAQLQAQHRDPRLRSGTSCARSGRAAAPIPGH